MALEQQLAREEEKGAELRLAIEKRRKEFERLTVDRDESLKRLSRRRIHTAQVEHRIRLLESALRQPSSVQTDAIESLLAAEEFSRHEKIIEKKFSEGDMVGRHFVTWIAPSEEEEKNVQPRE